jgi:hypothetical protein
MRGWRSPAGRVPFGDVMVTDGHLLLNGSGVSLHEGKSGGGG